MSLELPCCFDPDCPVCHGDGVYEMSEEAYREMMEDVPQWWSKLSTPEELEDMAKEFGADQIPF